MRGIAFLFAAAAFGLYANSAIAGPVAAGGLHKVGFSPWMLSDQTSGPAIARVCKQLAFERDDITAARCVAVETKARDTLKAMLPDTTPKQRSLYWGMCSTANRFGRGISFEYMGLLKCVRFTKAKCTPTPPYPRDNYARCLQAVQDRAFYDWKG